MNSKELLVNRYNPNIPLQIVSLIFLGIGVLTSSTMQVIVWGLAYILVGSSWFFAKEKKKK